MTGNSGDSPQAIEAALAALQIFASGHSGPRDLALQHFATSMHTTLCTSARLDGEVEIGSVRRDRPRKTARVGVEAIRSAARALVASGFPRIVAPPGPPPPPTVPPVRLAIARGETFICADLPASQVSDVPAFSAAVSAVGGLGDAVRAGAVATTEALRALADGGSPAELSIEVRFANGDRSFALTLGAADTLAETERRGARERTAVLGVVTAVEKSALARAFFSANFPEAHGTVTRVNGPHYVVRVALRDASIEVIVDAEAIDERKLGDAIRGLYAAASRFGVRPLELNEDPPRVATAALGQPPPAPPAGLSGSSMDIGMLFANNRENVADVIMMNADGSVSSGWYASRIQLGADVKITLSHRPAASVAPRPDFDLDLAKIVGLRVELSDGGDRTFGQAPPPAAPARAKPAAAAPAIAQELLDLVSNRMPFAAFARWLAEQKTLWVLATPTEAGGHIPHIARENNVGVLGVFTCEATLDVWLARARIEKPVLMRDTWGAGLFGGMPEFIGRVDVDSASPITMQIHGEPLATLRAVSRAVNAERAFGSTAEPPSAQPLLDHVYRVAWRDDPSPSPSPSPPSPPGVRTARLVSVPGPRGEPLAAAFSGDDCAEAFVLAAGGARSGITLATMTGRDILASLDFLRVDGVSFNPAGPGKRAIFGRDACAAMLR